MLSSEPNPWMNQLLQPSSLSATPAVEPYQLLLNPSKLSSPHDSLDEEVRSMTKPIGGGGQNVMRRHSRKSSQSDPYPTYASISESTTRTNSNTAITTAATNANATANANGSNNGIIGSTTGRASISTKSGNLRSLSRRNSTKMSDRSSVSHSDEDMEDEDMVNELLSLRDGVVKHGLQTRRVPLPDEETIRKMTPKERRQLRNKISARNFRLRRKEYIGTLEAEVKEVRIELDDYRTRCNDVEMENQALKKELRTMHDQLEMALAAAASVNLAELNNSISTTFDRAMLPSGTTLCTPVSPTTSYATATTPELLMMSPSASPLSSCYSSFNSTLGQKRPALRSADSNTPMLTRSSSPVPMSTSPRLTMHAEDIHQNCSSANNNAVSHANWSKNRIIVH
ncbi:hypothetical protein BDF22DRAFT_686620 [Syncephalis plumigaleata]|nr:hypothetical protein BDF22DRAFT_686620 [Syncephalis plumigaleata]